MIAISYSKRICYPKWSYIFVRALTMFISYWLIISLAMFLWLLFFSSNITFVGIIYVSNKSNLSTCRVTKLNIHLIASFIFGYTFLSPNVTKCSVNFYTMFSTQKCPVFQNSRSMLPNLQILDSADNYCCLFQLPLLFPTVNIFE